jgi:ParB family chromosome partitioning protein
MEQTTKLSIHSLKVHPRNQEFFDDIEGDTYEQFKKSIQEDGIITPIIVSPTLTVVSGHQRLKACIELGIELLPAIIREELVDDKVMLRQLLASNFGRIKNSPDKMRKVAVEYSDLVGFKKGDNQWVGNDCRAKLTQLEIANELGISERDLRNLLSIERNLIPELQQALDKGFISKTAALGICGKLEKSEQQDLLTELTKLIGIKAEDNSNKDKASVSNKEVEEMTNKIKELQETNKKLVEKNTELMNVQTEKHQLQEKIKLLNNELVLRPTVEIKVEKDKEETLLKLKRIEESEAKLKFERDEYQNKYSETLTRLNEQNTKVNYFMSESTSFEFTGNFSEFKQNVDEFINLMKKYDSFADALNEVPESTRREYVRNIYAVYKWARNILNEVKHDDVTDINKNIIEIVNFAEVK